MNMTDLQLATNAFDGGPPPAMRGELRVHESMAAHVSWRAGGTVARAYFPADADDLTCFLASLPSSEPVLFVGLGSNLLVRDGGFRGTAVFTHAVLRAIRKEPDGSFFVEAGVASPKVARYTATHGCVGAEFLAGIPGTMGGALAMNAGCYGGETWALVEAVLTVDRAGTLHRRLPADFEIGYRHVVFKGANQEWFLGAWLRLQEGDGERSREVIRELLERRVQSQPLQLPNAGSVFRNPPADYSARLIEDCGLKGTARGGARISEKHANFIVNPGGAGTATDIEALIGLAQEAVRTKHGIDLICEVRIVGDALPSSRGGTP